MLLGYVLTYSVAVVVFFVTARYRIPLIPVLLLFAGYGASRLIDHVRARRWKAWVPSVAITVAGFGLINTNPGPTTYLPPLTEEHLAVAAIRQGRSDLAENLLLRAIEERERSPRELLRLASIYEDRGEIDRAVQTLESIVKIPDVIPDLESTAHSTAARILANSGRAQDAIPHWRRVIEIDADSSYYHGEPYFHLGLGHFIRRYAWVELAKALESLGRLEEAADEYRAHLRVEPRAVEVLGRLALVAVELEEYEEAARVMKRYLKIQPGDASGHNLLGVALEGAGDLVGAEEAYQRSLEVSPTYARAYLNLAGLYREMSRVGEARSVLQLCLERNPDHEEALQLLREIRSD
jgi:tetratricopeptide (TPR) repeat protein